MSKSARLNLAVVQCDWANHNWHCYGAVSPAAFLELLWEDCKRGHCSMSIDIGMAFFRESACVDDTPTHVFTHVWGSSLCLGNELNCQNLISQTLWLVHTSRSCGEDRTCYSIQARFASYAGLSTAGKPPQDSWGAGESTRMDEPTVNLGPRYRSSDPRQGAYRQAHEAVPNQYEKS